jgi:tRNA(Arg) A34 adenosine deaminase TadA
MTSLVARTDDEFMRLAIEQSERAIEAGNMPFGAALVRDGTLLHVAQNNQLTELDLTGHAEVVLLRGAWAEHGLGVARGATVYASGEPCAMCTGAMFWAGVQRVVFAATQDDIIAALGGPALPIRTAEVLASATPAVVVEGGLQRAAAVAVLQRFALRARGGS